MNIGIVGTRRYQDRQSVLDLVTCLPRDVPIITSSCKGVCTLRPSEKSCQKWVTSTSWTMNRTILCPCSTSAPPKEERSEKKKLKIARVIIGLVILSAAYVVDETQQALKKC